MNTLFSLTSRSIRVFLQKTGEWVGGTTSEAPESIDSGRRNAIKAGLAGLLVVATATTAVNALAADVNKTQDGRDFASLSEKDVDGLPRTEKKAYYAWQHAELDRANVSIRDQINAKKGAMWQMIASVIPGLLLKAKNTGWKVTVEPIVREGIMMMARWELPPPEMRPQAQELIRYLA
jgi:hypothetical protein